MGTQYHYNHTKTCGCSMIFMFANVWLFDDMFNSYELQEKQNIHYYWGTMSKSEEFHDDWRGSQRENIKYQQGLKAKVDIFMVCGRGWRGRVQIGIRGEAALPQTLNQRKTWKPEALIADT